MANINTKILVVTHKPCKLPNCDLLVPVHAGRNIAFKKSKDGFLSNEQLEWLEKNTIGDNTGDNISDKNRYYNEVSAIYWAWKNYDKLDNPDYIGLMHYRRHFVFNDEYYKEKLKNATNYDRALAIVPESFINDNYINRIGFNTQNIRNSIENYDVIISYPSQLDIYFPCEYSSIRTDFMNNISQVNVKDFDLMVDILKRKYPNSAKEIDKFINGKNKYLYQMFIMKKNIFFDYCEFLFDVLFEIESKVDFSTYEINGQRSLGYLAEIMLTLFFIIKDSDKKLNKLEKGNYFC